jgi:hypothetical protein
MRLLEELLGRVIVTASSEGEEVKSLKFEAAYEMKDSICRQV